MRKATQTTAFLMYLPYSDFKLRSCGSDVVGSCETVGVMSDKTVGYDVGTVVRLKSGGPKMTVSSEPAQWGSANSGPWEQMCQWFVDNMAQEGHFPIASLKEVFETSKDY